MLPGQCLLARCQSVGKPSECGCFPVIGLADMVRGSQADQLLYGLCVIRTADDTGQLTEKRSGIGSSQLTDGLLQPLCFYPIGSREGCILHPLIGDITAEYAPHDLPGLGFIQSAQRTDELKTYFGILVFGQRVERFS